MGARKQTVDMLVGRHARKTVAVIRDRGHTTGTLESHEGKVCLLGGFQKAIAPMAQAARDRLNKQFDERFCKWMIENHPSGERLKDARCSPFGAGPNWNDNVLKTQEETLAWLEKFADAMDPQ